MKISMSMQQVALVAALSLGALDVRAEEAAPAAPNQTQAPSRAGDEVDAAADELVGKGSLAAADADAFKAQVRERLRQRDGSGPNAICAESEREQCRARLRQQVGDCDGEGRKHGNIRGNDDAARVAAALMLAASGHDDLEDAGTMVRAQLGKGWQAGDIEDAARGLGELRAQKRWHKEARAMLRECIGDDSCSPEQARVSLHVMQQASRRADLDARHARREIKRALNDELARGGKAVGGQGTGGKGISGQGSGDALRQRLQQRLRLNGEDAGGVGGKGEQKRHRYRRGQDGEGRMGGGFGGDESGGAGVGWGGGGGGGKPRGPGGN